MSISKNTKITFNGKTDFKVGGDKYDWDNGFLGYISIYSDSKKVLTVTATLTGSNWDLAALRLDGDREKLVIHDSQTGSGRNIEYLWSGKLGSSVTLANTHVDFMRGADDGADKVKIGNAGAGTVDLRGGDNSLTLGKGFVDTAHFWSGNDTVRTGSGGAGSIYTGGGNDKLYGGAGFIDQIVLGSGNNTFSSGSGGVGILSATGGNDVFTVGGGSIDTLLAGSGNNTINVSGDGRINSVAAFDGNDIVNFSGSENIDQINLGSGDNTVNLTGSGFVNTIGAYDGDDTVKITANGEVNAIALGNGNNEVTTANGFVTSIQSNSGNDTITIGAGGAGQIVSWGGDNTVTASGWSGSILLGAGHDTVNLLDGGTALSVLLRDGNDTLAVSQVTYADVIGQTCVFNGGDGSDTISFSQFTSGLSISLASSEPVDTGSGIFVVANFENLTGGGGADILAGNSDANRLDGGAGADNLTGGAAADVFVYSTSYGDDTVADFSIAQGDKIDLSGLVGIDSFADLSARLTQNGADTEISDGSGDVLILTNIAVADLTASQFVFA